jgi:twinkle protein
VNTFHDFKIDLGGRCGVELQTTCPQCSHARKKSKARCLSVNTVEGVWNCHHCGWAGSLRSGPDTVSRPPKRIVKPYFEKPSIVPPTVRDWFARRGIPEDIIARNGIALQLTYMPELQDEVPCLAFPYTRDGQVVNVKYRALEHKAFRQVKDAEKILYGLDDLTEDSAVIVEGECDKLALEVAGIHNSVSVPDGAPPVGSKPAATKFEYLMNCAAQLDSLKKIVLAVDHDPPGNLLEEELARRLGPERCWRVLWPEGSKDANDVLMAHGPEVLAQCVTSAKPYPIEGILEVADVAADVMLLYDQGLPRGVSTGLPSIDPYYTVKPGELSLVTGIPSHGKSEWLDWLMVQLAKLQGWVFAVCSPENLPLARHISKLAEKHVGLPFRAGANERMTSTTLAQALQWVHDYFVFIAPDDTITIDLLLSKAKSPGGASWHPWTGHRPLE